MDCARQKRAQPTLAKVRVVYDDINMHSLVMSPCLRDFLKRVLISTEVSVMFYYYLHLYSTHTVPGFQMVEHQYLLALHLIPKILEKVVLMHTT